MAAVSTALPPTSSVLIDTNTDGGNSMKVQGDERFRITSSGHFGIGITPSNTKLHVVSSKSRG